MRISVLTKHFPGTAGHRKDRIGKATRIALIVLLASAGSLQAARAERISNPVAEFSGLDKITGRITTFDVYINETV